jgi:hypothetical protein
MKLKLDCQGMQSWLDRKFENSEPTK